MKTSSSKIDKNWQNLNINQGNRKKRKIDSTVSSFYIEITCHLDNSIRFTKHT